MSVISGTKLGPYEVVASVGAGGMGEVYRARDTRLDREVAIKILHPQSDAELRARFEREARAISSLQHSNICVLYDIGRQDKTDFLVMEYLRGETLAMRTRLGPLPVKEVLNIAISVASALGAAHRQGIIHRDLKPANIMLTEAGAKLLDFGVAAYLQNGGNDVTALTAGGQIIGTLPYMSPEQLRGKLADARSDIFGFGCVLYEMLTGRSAFQRKSNIDTIAAIGNEEPKSINEFRDDVPEELEHIIGCCLRKRPEERYASMSEIERNLQNCRTATSESINGVWRVLLQRSKRPRVAILLVLTLLLLGTLVVWTIYRSSRVRWAKDQAIPQIAELVHEGRLGEAYTIAAQAERYIPHDPMLIKFWPDISWSTSIRTTPSGALVYRRSYNALDAKWELIGRSPIEKRRFSPVDSQWKFELKGFATVERATFASNPPDSFAVTLYEENKAPPGMLRVELATPAAAQTTPVTLFGVPGFEALPAIPLSNYWIDRYEVTNAEFKRFLDQGGYQRQEYWNFKFQKGRQILSRAEAVKLFRDKTERPGPATWIQGEYPRGQGDFPVTGVSWFEAAAYAQFAAKSLPTIYHWTAAASPVDSPSIIPASNFSEYGPSRVGRYQGMSWTGAYDMAGNVKEWVLNEASSGKRYIMGGAWDEPTYMFNDADARDPFERSANFGFRCARYLSTGEAAKAVDQVTVQARDYSKEKPVSDQLFQVYKSLYLYDRTPLHPLVESIQAVDNWKREKITFDAAYGNERMIAYLFLPARAQPPFQTVVYFPGAGAVHLRSSADSLSRYLHDFDFILKSGRAVMFPVYKSTFERGDNVPYPIYWPNTSTFYRDHVIEWFKDLSRSIDYLDTRSDIDHSKLAYEGFSLGAAMGAIFPAMEHRFKVIVLIAPGLYLQRRLPEVDQINFAPRVTAPVLMLNGRFDFIWPPGSSQEPMFRFLGTPKEHKRRVVYNTGHDIPQVEMIKETLNWLDRYLGPVK